MNNIFVLVFQKPIFRANTAPTLTHGKYLKYSLNNNDLSNFSNTFNRHNYSKDMKINQKRQLFYYPLLLASALLFFAFFSLPRKP
jgi:Ca-activated chloride channel family protein